MFINEIPGWFSGSQQLEIIKLVSRYNYPNCVGVEVGCLHGRSSAAISLAINAGKLYCIDIWGGEETYNPLLSNEQVQKNNFPKKGLKNTLEVFLENTKERKNIIHVQGPSPSIVENWSQMIDFIFLDASHSNPNDRENIDFWLPKIKSGGMFIGHDWYENKKFPDVNLNVEYIEALLGLKAKIIPSTSIWYFELTKEIDLNLILLYNNNILKRI